MPLFDNYLPGSGFSRSAVSPVLNGRMPNADWVRLRQPYLDRFGRACVTITDLKGGFTRNDSKGGEPKPLLRNYLIQELQNRGMPMPLAANAATLRKEEWIELDRMITLAYRQRLRAAEDLEAASSYGGFNAYSRMTLEYQAMSDPGQAIVDMDGRTDGRSDTPLFILRSLPLPITHSDFGYSDRELEVSGNLGSPLDVTMGEAAARRVAESIEDQVIGNVTGVTYATQTAGAGTHTGTSTVYGYTNFTYRLTKTNFTAPTAGGWVPNTTYSEVLVALNQLRAQYSYGPFMLYYSTDWDSYMGQVFSVSGGNNNNETLQSMLAKHPDLSGVRRLDRLTSTYTLIFVQMTSEVAQMVNGMEINTVQWTEKGGLDRRFKVMAIKVPRLRADYSNRTGILHGTTA